MPSVTALSVSPTSQIAWLSSDGTLRVWDGNTVTSPLTVPNPRLLAFSSHITISHDDPPHIRRLRPSSSESTKVAVSGIVVALASHPHSLYASFHEGAITIGTFEGATIASLSHPTAPLCAVFSPDVKHFATADIRGNIRVFRPPDYIFTTRAQSAVPSLAWSDKYLASAGWDGKARLWDLSGREIMSFRPNRQKLHAVALSPDGNLLAAAGASGDVSVWRLSEKRTLAVHSAHKAAVHVLAFTPDSRHVASGGADGTVRLFGVPTKPQLVTEAQRRAEDENGLYHIAPAQSIVEGQRADRRLIFVPSMTISLSCPVCNGSYNNSDRKPVCSGVCGHTFACSTCSERLLSTETAPRCPICRAALVDVAYNYELLRVLSAARSNSTASESFEHYHEGTSAKDVIKISRLSWVQDPQLAYSTSYASIIHKGHFDGEVVAIRVPRETTMGSYSLLAGAALSFPDVATKRHLSCLRSLRGPHLPQFYGVARMSSPDNRLLVVSELPSGGTLAENFSFLRTEGRWLSSEGIQSLATQILKAVRFLHESDVSGGHAISPSTISLSSPLEEDWDVQRRIKIVELGGTLSKADCAMDTARSFPSSFVGYMAPELLDEDRSVFRRNMAFQRACQADMYSIGVLIWEIATGKPPFEGMRPAQVVAAVIGRSERPGYPPDHIPSQLQELITSLWVQDPARRPDARQACRVLDSIPSAPPL